MGLFSFLFGRKKDKAAVALRPTAKPADRATTDAGAIVAHAPSSATASMAQAKLRLKLAASLRSGEHAAAYAAARELGDIQLRAGRKTVARVWQQQAERIRVEAGLAR